MTCTPGIGSLPSRLRSASAGGQLEQPSDVKSSTTTGTRSEGPCATRPVAAMTASVTSPASLTMVAPLCFAVADRQIPRSGSPLGRLHVDRDLHFVAHHRRGLDHLIVRQ